MTKYSLLKRILLTLLVLLALSASTLYYLFIMQPFQEMRALNYQKFSQEEFLQEISPNNPSNKVSSYPESIEVEINFIFPEQEEETLLSIRSGTISETIYFGEYKKNIFINATPQMFINEGGDNLKISLFRKKTLEIFSGSIKSAQIWVPGKKVFIELLPYQEIDPRTGVPITFKVYLK